MKRMFLISIMVMTALMVLSSNASASTYRFYHVAVRDFNGDGAVNGNDHIRYGFTGNDRTPVKAMLYNSTGTLLQEKFIGNSWNYKESYNGGVWNDESYYGVKFDYREIPTGAIVWLLDADSNPFSDPNSAIASHNVTIPSNPLPSAYNGYDPMTLNWQWDGMGNLQMNWDAISSPSTIANSHRFVMEANIDGIFYSFFNKMDGDDTTGFTFDGSLFAGGLEDVIWTVHFEQRFENPDGFANFNWLRSYSEFCDIDLSTDGTTAVPIPGAVWLLGSGLVGFVGLRRKFIK